MAWQKNFIILGLPDDTDSTICRRRMLIAAAAKQRNSCRDMEIPVEVIELHSTYDGQWRKSGSTWLEWSESCMGGYLDFACSCRMLGQVLIWESVVELMCI